MSNSNVKLMTVSRLQGGIVKVLNYEDIPIYEYPPTEYGFTYFITVDGRCVRANITEISKDVGIECDDGTVITTNDIKKFWGDKECNLRTINEGAFEDCENLLLADIPKGVIDIGESAFKGCYNMYGLNIPNGVQTIGDYAFYMCDGFSEVVIPGTVNKIGKWAFRHCTSLDDLRILKGVSTIGDHAFHDCGSLTKLEIPSTVENIGHFAFSNCTQLANLTLPESMGSSDEDPGMIGDYAFDRCESLEEVVIPNYIKEIQLFSFNGCRNLQKVTIPDTVKTIHIRAFCDCSNLTEVVIPESVDIIQDSAFARCKQLRKVYINSGVTHIKKYAFQDCTKLTSLIIPNSVKEINNNAFDGCTSLEQLSIKFDSSGNLTLDGNIFKNTGLKLLEIQKYPISKVQQNQSSWGIPKGCACICGDGMFIVGNNSVNVVGFVVRNVDGVPVLVESASEANESNQFKFYYENKDGTAITNKELWTLNIEES